MAVIRFSQRMGFDNVRSIIQIDEVDTPLKNGIWNVLHDTFWDDVPSYWRYSQAPLLMKLFRALWSDFYKARLDSISEFPSVEISRIRKDFFDVDTPWHHLYDLVEFISGFLETEAPFTNGVFKHQCNLIFEREMSGYRFVKGVIAPIISEIEVKEIEESLKYKGKYGGVSVHLKQALSLLSDKVNPDYRNSIKESISAVESVVKESVGDSSGGIKDALKALEKNGVTMHPSLREALVKLYGYTSDEGGIRHAIFGDVPNITFDDAKYMMVICSGFCNYIIAKNKG